jgi:hypothetical protein
MSIDIAKINQQVGESIVILNKRYNAGVFQEGSIKRAQLVRKKS